MKNKKDDIFYESMRELDESDIEKIAEEIPPLDSKAKKRILNRSLKKMNCDEMIDDFEPEITVSGTEKITISRFKSFAVTAAAFAVVAAGISGIALINKNLRGTVESTLESSTTLVMSSDSKERQTRISNEKSVIAQTDMTNASSAVKIISESRIPTVQTETSTVVSEVSMPENTDAVSDVQDTGAAEGLPKNLIGIWKNEYLSEPRFISIDENGNFCTYDENGAESNSGTIRFSRAAENDQQLYLLTSYENTLNFELCMGGDNYFHSTDSEISLSYEKIGSEFGVPIINDDNFCGKYEMMNGGNSIEIVKTGDNLYSIELSFYRVAAFSDGIGSVDENGNLTFSTGSVTGAPPISGQIIPWENGVYLKITESEHTYIPVDSLPVEEWENYLYYKQK